MIQLNDWIFSVLANHVYTAHLEKKIRFDVVEPDKIGSKFKSALEKEGMLKDIKGADYIVRFAEKIEAQPPADEESPEDSEETPDENPEENSEETDSKEETPEETPEEDPEEDSKEEETTEEPEKDAEEDSEDDSADEDSTGSEDDSEDDSEEDDKKKGKKEVNESMKVQDLTKSMLLPVKGQSGKSASPKTSKSTSAKSSPKKCTGKDGKCTKCENECAEKNTGKKSGKI